MNDLTISLLLFVSSFLIAHFKKTLNLNIPDRRSDGDNFMQNAGQSNNRNFGNRSFNAMDGCGSGGGAGVGGGNGNANSNFYDDFDLNEFAKNINTLDRLVNLNRNTNNRQNFNPGSSGNDNNFSGNANWMRNQGPPAFNSRGGNVNSFGGTSQGFNNDCSNDQDDNRSGQHCIHMRGLPYYTDEMDVFNVSFSATNDKNLTKVHSNLIDSISIAVFRTFEAKLLQDYHQ